MGKPEAPNASSPAFRLVRYTRETAGTGRREATRGELRANTKDGPVPGSHVGATV